MQNGGTRGFYHLPGHFGGLKVPGVSFRDRKVPEPPARLLPRRPIYVGQDPRDTFRYRDRRVGHTRRMGSTRSLIGWIKAYKLEGRERERGTRAYHISGDPAASRRGREGQGPVLRGTGAAAHPGWIADAIKPSEACSASITLTRKSTAAFDEPLLRERPISVSSCPTRSSLNQMNSLRGCFHGKIC